MVDQSKPTIVWLHSHFLYWMGGTKFVYEVIKKLNKDFRILVIVENSTEEAKKKYDDIGIKLISLNKTTSTSRFYWISFPIQIFIDFVTIKHLLQPYDYQCMVTSMFPMNIFPHLLRKKHVQYCFEPFAFFHDPDFIKNFPVIKRSLIKLTSFFYKWLDVSATKSANSVITLNNTTAKFINEVYKIKPRISFTGIDTKHFHPFVSQELLAKYKNVDVIIHSTDYTPVKGTDLMIKIFARIKKQNPKVRLLITSTINNAREKDKLGTIAQKLGVKNDVEFLGFIDYDILPQLYSVAKVLVQCSYSERSGTTSMALPVKEAMACGTLCIRFPIKGEDVVDGVTGYLVDPRDMQEMTNKIIKILNMKQDKYQRASKKARTTIVDKYNWVYTSDIVKREIDSIIQ